MVSMANLMVRVWVLCLLVSSFSPARCPSIFLLSSLKVFSTLSNLTPLGYDPIRVVKIPMERVGLTPLVEKGERVGETHGEAVLGEAGALKVLIQTIG